MKVTVFITAAQNAKFFDNALNTSEGFAELSRVVRNVVTNEDGALIAEATVNGRNVPVISNYGDTEFYDLNAEAM